MSFDVEPLSQLTFAYSYVVGGQRGGQLSIGWNSCPLLFAADRSRPQCIGLRSRGAKNR